ncbi:hypothetical protein BH23CHL4_BH23CHL4_12520 [soil metagenome]
MNHPLIDEYLRIAFHLDRHFPGFIDAYFGDPEAKERVLAEPLEEPVVLAGSASSLHADIESADFPESRKDYLQKQTVAMQTIARKLAGEEIAFIDEVAGCFDIVVERISDEVFDESIAALDALLPGSGAVAERMAKWRAGSVIDEARTRQALDLILGETRRRTAEFIPLPENESVEIGFVRDKPWRGYNWYLGSARSRVEINLDIPQYANDLVNLVAHEAYPGHHTEHCVKGETLYRERGYDEMSIQLINTPECVIHEGIATLAEVMIFPGDDAARWKQDVLYPAIGITGYPEQERQIQHHTAILRASGGNAALMRHVDGTDTDDIVAYIMKYLLRSEEESRHRLQFIDDPLWRPYIFTYHVGRDLLGAWLDQAPAGERLTRFRTLLTEQVTPSHIRAALPQ